MQRCAGGNKEGDKKEKQGINKAHEPVKPFQRDACPFLLGMTRSNLKVVHDGAKELRDAGLIKDITMRELNALEKALMVRR